jgi:hypothetical protein
VTGGYKCATKWWYSKRTRGYHTRESSRVGRGLGVGKSSRVDWFVVRFEASFRLLEESEQGFASFLCAKEEVER